MIVEMRRVRIAASRNAVDFLVRLLYENGAMHVINSQNDGLLSQSGLELGAFGQETAETLQRAEELLLDVRTCVSFLGKYDPARKDILLIEPDPKAGRITPEFETEIKSIVSEITQTAKARILLDEELREISEWKGIFEEFQPLVETVASLTEVEVSGVFFREKSRETENKMRELEEALDKTTGGAYSTAHSAPQSAFASCLFIYPASLKDEVGKNVFDGVAANVQTVRLPTGLEKATFAESLLHMFKRESKALVEIEALRATAQEHSARWTSLLRTTEKLLEKTVGNLKLQNFLALSGETCWITGWTPEKNVINLETLLNEKLSGEMVFFSEPPHISQYGDVPVALKNPSWARPFEKLLAIFPAPAYGSIDPTILMVIFFPLFFGLMLGDLGYAALLALLSFFIRSRKPGDPLWSDISVIIGVCAFSAAFFGIIYGELFGKLWGGLGLPPPLFHRKEGMLQLLTAAFVVGGFHVMLGALLGFINSIRVREARHAIINLSGAAMVGSALWIAYRALNSAPYETGVTILLGSVALKLAAGGLRELLEMARIISNVLSYARLMALGLASVILADLASDVYISSDILLVGLAGALTIHALNFVLGVFAPGIQAIRLHYVEFFNQFYKHGRIKYTPLGKGLNPGG